MSWAEANQRYLVAELAVVRAHLDRHARQASPRAVPDETRAEIEAAAAALEAPAAVDQLAEVFGLSDFERTTLLLLAGVELDASFAAACAAAAGEAPAGPTFALALAVLPGGHWSALSPSAPLRWWKLIEVGPGQGLTTARLRIDERVLHHLTGIDGVDERLHGLVSPLPDRLLEASADGGRLPPSHHRIVEQVLHVWSHAGNGVARTIVQLWGTDRSAMSGITASAAAHAGMQAYELHDDDIPAGAVERNEFTRLWEREAALSARVLLVSHGDGEQRRAAARLAGALRTPVVLAGRETVQLVDTTTVDVEVSPPTSPEQRALWQRLLGPESGSAEEVDAVVRQFDFPAGRIRAAAADFTARAAVEPGARLWDAARLHARPHAGDLAQRIDVRATWEQLVLPDRQLALLRQIAAQVRHRGTVYDDWGFAARESRGLGITALFSGHSGTGKTLAAEVLANELALDLYRIDLSSVVSKYIGDTEKNLRRVFDDAESGGSILLFDEADALFGRRSEVKDSHDRYANIEVSYLLQRMEAYRGLAVLTTNLKDGLDPAFLRRIRFVVEFRHPDRQLRERIWSGAFPTATPVTSLAPERLSQLAVAGGNIRNMALGAAFMAADEGSPVRMAHVAQAARDEFAKLERTLSEEVLREW